MNQYAKSFVHNVIVHPLMMVLPKNLANAVHDLNANWAFGLERFDELALEANKKYYGLTPQQMREFDKACQPLIEWLNDNKNPHATVIVGSTSAELFDSACQLTTIKHLKD